MSRDCFPSDKKCLQLSKTEKFSLFEWIYFLQSAKDEEKLQQIENQSMSWTCVWKAENSIFLHNRLEISVEWFFHRVQSCFSEMQKDLPSSVSWADHFSRFGALEKRSRVLSHKFDTHSVVFLNKCSKALSKVMIWILGSFMKIRLREIRFLIWIPGHRSFGKDFLDQIFPGIVSKPKTFWILSKIEGCDGLFEIAEI